MLTDLKVEEFILETAAGSPVPGGGSVSALAGALAAALSAMVARLTIGKKGFEAFEKQLAILRDSADALRNELIQDVDRDATAYENFLFALRLPKETAAERETRQSKLAEAMTEICRVPLTIAQNALDALEQAAIAVTLGRKDIVTDAAVAVLLAGAAVRGALFNVKFNLADVKEEAYVAQTLARVEQMERDVKVKEKAALKAVGL
ncbi:MAG: cyclodeaminase/cyclohydrolase family protein [Desulfobacterales bacterium]|jgi:formiminotetrahydrofolate cyclodeaminase|nr:cyclodeaminase/cyclohydrolase family protein [Desulfobacterales bacterium]